MDASVQATRNTLKDWEDWLAPQVRQVELLAEIPITAEECVQLGKVIGLRVQALGHGRALQTLESEYPSAFAVYLVAQGIYGYQGGDYWTEVVQATGLNRNYAWQIGQTFETILEDLGLPLFYDMRAEKAHRYVSLILAHGGVPDYCLPDFFANMLQPAVTKAYYADMSAAELIDEWLWHASGRYFTDKPVLRFLEFSGEVAIDFVERCREMALEYLESEVVPDAQAIGLPQRVVEAYAAWIARQDVDQVQREEADQWRLRKPQILVDPWGEGVFIDLPPQQVPATELYADITWRIMAGDEENTVPVHVRRSGYDRKTESASIALSQPAELYQVSLLVDGESKRTWRYAGVDEQRPLIVFAPEGAMMVWQHSLPACRLGLLYPTQLVVHAQGGEKLEDLPRMPWDWAAFRGEIWDLTHASDLVLKRGEEIVLNVALRPDEASQRPQLVSGQLLQPETASDPAVVYVGSPPSIRIPLVGRVEIEEELTRWRLSVSNKWPAAPDAKVKTTLATLYTQVQTAPDFASWRSRLAVHDGCIDVPLGLPMLLGENPRGNYDVRLRGPLGRDARFKLRILPHLVLCGEDIIYVPSKDGPVPAQLLVETAVDDILECQVEDGECCTQLQEQCEDYWEYEVEVGSEITAAELAVIHSLPNGDVVRVPIPLRIRRLRWALVDAEEVANRRIWTGRPIRRPIETLLQSQSPCLLVILPLAEESDCVNLQLRLLDVDGAELQIIAPVSPPRRQRLWRFELAGLLDTIRASRSPVLRVELSIPNLPNQDSPVRLTVLSLTQTLIVEDVRLEARLADGDVVFDLRWQEPSPLRNRHMRLWHLWRPWETAFEQAIPDEVEGTYSFNISPHLYPGKYRIEFLVVDPWTPPENPQKPPQGVPSTADIGLISPDIRIGELGNRLREQGPCFELLLERAFVYQDIGGAKDAQPDWQWCFDHLDEGTVPQILALLELVQNTGDHATLTALKLKMFARGRLERLFQERESGKISKDCFQQYTSCLPRSGLLPQDTCQILLTVDNETARLYAAQQLIRRQDVLGVDAILTWVDAAALSDTDAIALLALNPNFAVECLFKQPDNATAHRLLNGLGQAITTKTIIRAGEWIRCDLGWGRVDSIENYNTGTKVEWMFSEASGYALYVTLRPDVHPEPVHIYLESATAGFVNPGQVLTCAKCKAFSTQSREVLLQHFQLVHPVHRKGDGRSVVTSVRYRREEPPLLLRNIKGTSREPDNQLK